MIILSLILACLLGTANMVYADTILLEEHFPDDPIGRGWTYGGDTSDPFEWKYFAGNSGAMYTRLATYEDPYTRYSELMSPSFDTLDVTNGFLTFNYSKNPDGGMDAELRLQYRLDDSEDWTQIWKSGLGLREWPTEVNLDLPTALLDQTTVELRWYVEIYNPQHKLMILKIVVDDVAVTSFEEPTPAPTNTPSATPTPDCIRDGDVNQDSVITSADAQLAFLITLGQYAPTHDEECAADCNGDDRVTSADAQLIFQTGLGTANCVDPL